MNINLSNSEILALVSSLLFLFPLSREFLSEFLSIVFYPAFALEDKMSEIFYLRMQRDELLALKSKVEIKFLTDTLKVYPVRFKGYCQFIAWSNGHYPPFIKVKCEDKPKEGDIIWALGLVGFVVKNNNNYAEVQTIYSQDFYAKVVVNRSSVMGILKGGNPPKIEFLPYGSDIKVGDTLYLQEHPGVYVGTVKYVFSSPPFITVEVEPLWRYEVWTKFSLLEPLYIF
ncbi:MAG: rod shape-determining protein MreC [candidate division WOR-3 bacterium]